MVWDDLQQCILHAVGKEALVAGPRLVHAANFASSLGTLIIKGSWLEGGRVLSVMHHPLSSRV
jgi:hypothetical protein